MSSDLEAALWGALAGAGMGGLVSFVSECILDRRRRSRMLKDKFSDNAFDFVANVESYWSLNGQDPSMQAAIVAGINKMRAGLVNLGFDLQKNAEVRLLMKEIFQFATGGLFASQARTSDTQRAANVSKRVASLSSLVAAQT